MKKNKTLLDIAVLTAGRVDLFSKCVDAILPQMQPEYKIHVCNNGHPSSEYEEIYKRLPQGSVIRRNNLDGGFGAGANSAIKSGNAPLVLFVTDDVFLHLDTVSKLINTMDDPAIGQCGLKLLFPEDSLDPSRPAGKVQHIGMAANIRGDMVHPLMAWSPENPKCCKSGECLAVTGASFIIRRSVFNAAGGFDRNYGKGYYEDVDLSLTIRSIGYKIFIDTDATATHGVGQTFAISRGDPPNLQQNKAYFMSKHLPHLIWNDWMYY